MNLIKMTEMYVFIFANDEANVYLHRMIYHSMCQSMAL